MQPDELKALLETQLADSSVQVEIDGSHFHLTVVSPIFDGARPVKRQQMVYAVLSELIADGSIHAVHIQTYTPQEREQQQGDSRFI